MKKQLSIRSLAVPVLMFIIGFGLMAGCSNKKANNDEMNDSGQGEMTAQDNMSKMQAYTSDLTGDAEVPAVTTDASGMVTVTLDGNSVHVKGQFSGLGSKYTASHIHMGPKGEDGPVVQPLDPTINDDNMSGSFDASYTLPDSAVTALKNGMLYVNVHSNDHKGGEIRGQLKASDNAMNSSMDDN